MKKKRLVVLGLTTLMLTGALTGCSKELEDAQNNLNHAAIDALNSSKIVQMVTEDEISNFAFSGADFVLNGDIYTLDVSGFTTNAKDQKAYANMEYEVAASEFATVDASDSVQVTNAITKVIQEYEMKSFDYAPMTSLTQFNKAMNKTFESPLEGGYHVSSGLTYAVDDITYNEQDGYVSFMTRQNVDYSKTTTRIVLIYNGKTMMPVAQSHTDHEKFNQEHEIYIRANATEIAAMKENPNLIFEKFVNLVNEEQKTEYTVRAGNIQNEKPFNDASEYHMDR